MDVVIYIIGALFVIFIAWCCYIIIEAIYYQAHLGPGLERDLGFHQGSVYLGVGRQLHSAVAITEVTANGVFAQAGFHAGNVLIGVSHTDLFKLLHRNRGKNAELTIVDGGDGPPFFERPTRMLSFVVPPKE